MYFFLYSAQTVLQYYVAKMDVHVCIFLEKKYYAWLVSFNIISGQGACFTI